MQFDPNYNVLKPDAPLLKDSVLMEKGINNPLFLSGVGGISFNQVAQPDNNLQIASLKMNYNDTVEDGKRLELMINHEPIPVNLPDWLLIPLANYANNPWSSRYHLWKTEG
jgi:hypothetical protein